MTSQCPLILQRTKPKYFTAKLSNVQHLLIKTSTSPHRKSDLSSSRIWILLVRLLDSSSIKVQNYAVKLEEWFVNFFTLACRLSDGLACCSYGGLVGWGHKVSKNRRDGVEFAMSSHRWFGDFPCWIFGNLIGGGQQSSKMRWGIV